MRLKQTHHCTVLLRAGLAALVLILGPVAADASEPDVERFAKWNELVLTAVSESTSAPCLASRNLAILHGAAFDAVNSFSGKYSSFRYNQDPPVGTFPAAAMTGAMWKVASELFPSHSALYDAERDRQLEAYRSIHGDPAVESSFAYGVTVATAVLQVRADDGASTRTTYVPKDAPGKWRRTPPRYRPPEMPSWYLVRPFVLNSADQFRPAGPPPLDSEAYRAAVREVYELGGVNSNERTLADANGAVFWACFSYTSTPAGHWNEIARRIAVEQKMSLLESARMMALLNLATADAGIAAWECKYYYELWRPIQAIRAATDEFEDAVKWNSLLVSPPHPEYVSGHSTFSGAAAALLAGFFENDAVPFWATSSEFPGVQRRYDSFWKCAEEIGQSRLYGGIHFSFSNRDGLELGKQVAQWVLSHSLQPVTEHQTAVASVR